MTEQRKPLVERVEAIHRKAKAAGLVPPAPKPPSEELPLDYAQRAAGEHRAA